MSFGPKPIVSGSPGAVTAEEEVVINAKLGSCTTEDPAAAESYADGLDSAQTAALGAHTGAANPHSGSAAASALSDHTGAANPHSGSASLSDLSTHTGAANPHSGSAATSALSSHTGDATIHRSINDSGSAATDLWSASKLTTDLSGKSGTAHTHAAYEQTVNKDQNSGYAGVSSTGVITFNQMPVPLIGGRLEYVDTTTLKWAFKDSNQAGLFYGGDRRLIKMTSEPTLSNSGNDMGGNAKTYDKNYAVFMNATANTAAELLIAPWYSDTARAGAWLTGTNYYVGDPRTNGGNTYVCISAHTSGTFATDLAAGKWIQIESDGLGLFEGTRVLAPSGIGLQYLHIGDVRLVNNSGAKFASDDNYAYIWNRHHPRLTVVQAENSTASWTYAGAWRISNNGTGQTSGKFLIGEARIGIALISQYGYTHSGESISVAPAIDGIKGKSGTIGVATMYAMMAATTRFEITPGYHLLNSYELSASGTPYFYAVDSLSCNISLMM